MIPQSDLAAYWQAPARHGFIKAKFDVRVNEYDRKGRFLRSLTLYVCAWTADEAKAVALRRLREYENGRFAAMAAEYSQPVVWN